MKVSRFSRGAIALVALSFVSVLGLVLAGYFAISQQSMRLSNRSYGATVSEQLAELGLEEALRAITTNNFADWTSGTAPNQTSVDWTLSGTTATATITPPATRYGNSGVAGTAKIRIDNYDAFNRPAAWTNGTAYRIGDLIGDAGTWYRCVQNHTAVTATNQPPNLTFWVPAPIPWQWSSDTVYNQFEIVNSGGTWYRYVNSTAASGNALSDPRYWRAIPSGLPLPTAWNNTTTYYTGSVVSDSGSWFVYINPTSSSGNATSVGTHWQQTVTGVPWTSSNSYSLGQVVSSNGLWYYCSTAQSPTASFPSANWTLVTPFSTLWVAATGFARGSIIFWSGVWYYCIASHTSSASDTPPNATRWVPFSGSGPTADSWQPSTAYYAGDYVYVLSSGLWYYCRVPHTSGAAPFSATNWVTSTTNPSTQPFIRPSWRTSVIYRFNDVVFFSTGTAGTWYRCIAQHTSSATITPTGTNAATNWENAVSGGATGWAASLNYNIGDTVNYGANGLWYRCIRAHTSSGSSLPTNAANWSPAPLRSPAWDSGRNYTVDDVALYGGIWYRCLAVHNGINPSLNATSEVASGATWAAANTASSNWNSTMSYTTTSRVTFAGDWYRCILANDNIAPGNATYWTKMDTADMWNSTTAYTTASRVTYGNVWYRCAIANTNIAPGKIVPNSNPEEHYWIAMGAPVIYADGTATLIRDDFPLRTQLRANVAVAPLVPNAVAGTTTLTINGAGTVDSYDSKNGTYASQTPGFSAVLAAGLTTGTAATITNTVVRGYVAAPPASAAPHATLTSFGGSAAVTGTLAGTTVDQTRVSRSPFIPQFDPLPDSLGGTEIENGDLTAASSDTLNLGTPGATTPSRYFFNEDNGYGAGNLNLGNPSSGFSLRAINILGPVILYVDGYLYIRGGTTANNAGIIDIKSTGSLELHCSVIRTYAGSHGIVNRTLDPTKLTLIADSNANTATYLRNGNSAIVGINKEFYGVIYVPNTTATVGLEVQTGAIFYGAISAREVTFNAEANVRYDTTLRSTAIPGVERAFLLTDWRELTSPAERVTLP